MAAQCCGWGGKKKRKGGGEEGSFGRNTTSDGEGRIDGALSYKLSSPCAQMLCPKRREGSGFVASPFLLPSPSPTPPKSPLPFLFSSPRELKVHLPYLPPFFRVALFPPLHSTLFFARRGPAGTDGGGVVVSPRVHKVLKGGGVLETFLKLPFPFRKLDSAAAAPS